MDIILSIIIPSFNMENSIEKCIRSALDTQSKNIELIVVNDGSNDNTVDIVNKIVLSDSRVRIINIDNSGVSFARNVGIKHCKGKYFTFLDADDWLEKGAVDLIIDKINESPKDIYVFNRYLNFENDINNNISKKPVCINELNFEKYNIVLSKIVGFSKEKDSYDDDVLGWNGCKVYSYSCFAKNRYNINIRYGEDTLFILEAFLKTTNIKMYEERIYHYYINSKSATHKSNDQIINQTVLAIESIKTLLGDKLENQLIRQGFYQRNIYKMLLCIDLYVRRGINSRKYLDNKNRIKEILNVSYYKEAIALCKQNRLNKKTRIHLFFLKYRLFCIYLFILKNI